MAGRNLTLITGGAGYIGSMLTRALLMNRKPVRVADSYLFGDGLAGVVDPNLECVHIDIRHAQDFAAVVRDAGVVIHLAAIANDPSFELDPELSRSVNYESLDHLIRLSKEAGVRRFIYASSASVYGISHAPEVTEEHSLVPVTDYNRYKALGERLVFASTDRRFETVAVRAATVCGYSTRQRLDLTANLLTAQATVAREITVFGGSQFRPNIHIADLVDVYHRLASIESLGWLSGQPLNVGNENMTVSEIASVAAGIAEAKTGSRIAIKVSPSADRRSYRLTSRRLVDGLGITPKRGLREACAEIADAILAGSLPDALGDPRYYNVRWMKQAKPPRYELSSP